MAPFVHRMGWQRYNLRLKSNMHNPNTEQINRDNDLRSEGQTEEEFLNKINNLQPIDGNRVIAVCVRNGHIDTNTKYLFTDDKYTIEGLRNDAREKEEGEECWFYIRDS